VQQHLHQLKTLHGDLLAALDGGDVERISALVSRRAELITGLQRAYEAAPAEARHAIQPGLAALLPLDRDLQSRAGALKDHLRTELDQRQDAGTRPPHPTITGVVDRQA